jgi:hypothetical protein
MGLSCSVFHNQDFQEFTISCMSGTHPTNVIYFYSITLPTQNTVLQYRIIKIFTENIFPNYRKNCLYLKKIYYLPTMASY